ncbi:GlsB/YeaQ/YmgE family stress response membrane protein [Candidatus Giovannonibacteria bacterium]|nr:GlsB/YeaQ/YmgE family stress response membrane protein [Candidatus Giovannonibacteria bacterium]
MNILLWVIFGGLAGWVGSLIVGGDAQMGIFANIVVGIVGALIGGWIADQTPFGGKPGAERPTSFLSFGIAVLGAVILLFVINMIF